MDYLINFPNPTINSIKRPTISDVVYKKDALLKNKFMLSPISSNLTRVQILQREVLLLFLL